MDASDLIIDCDAPPFCPDRTWRVKSHLQQGRVEWAPEKVRLSYYSGQESLSAYELLKRMEAHKEWVPWNANPLDWYVAHPEEVPADWCGLNIWFPGTTYHVGLKKTLHIRGLNIQPRGISWVKKWVGKAEPKNEDDPIPYFDRNARIALVA